MKIMITIDSSSHKPLLLVVLMIEMSSDIISLTSFSIESFSTSDKYCP